MEAFLRTRLTAQRALLLALLVLIAALATGLAHLQKQPSVEALVPTDNPALALRTEVRERFGLKDPVVIALAGKAPGALLDPEALQALRRLTDLLRKVPGIDPEQVFSLSTGHWVRGDGQTLEVLPLLPDTRPDAASIKSLQQALIATPQIPGSLIARDGSAALIAAELQDGAEAVAVYRALMQALKTLPLPQGLDVHVAGEAIASGYLSEYIDRDAKIITPAAGALMLLCLLLTLKSRAALLAGALVMLGTLAATIGLMGWRGAPIYIITSCLPAVLLCVSIADAVHFIARVRRLLAQGLDRPAAIARAHKELWRPILLTSLTNAAGFIALAASAELPPLLDYGLYAAFGVAVAWVLTLIALPLALNLLAIPAPKTVARTADKELPRWLHHISEQPARVLAAIGVLMVLSALAATQVQFNEERIRNFASDSPVYQADALLNSRFDGVHQLDIQLKTVDGSSLLQPDLLARIASLQDWMRTQGGFDTTSSFIDILNNVAAAAQGVPVQSVALPATRDEAEQYLFLYEVSAPPGDLRQEITATHDAAYVRGGLKQNNYQQARPLITQLRAELDQRFASTAVIADITGAVALTHSWVGPLLPGTLTGALAAALMVGLLAALMLRSALEGVLCSVTVTLAILVVFGLMGLLGIWLNVANSMFASISIGLGVDFAIHTLHALRQGRNQGLSGPALTRFAWADVGAPLTGNLLILVIGFSITCLSSIPPLRSFGMLVSASVVVSYLAALLVLPALMALATTRTAARNTSAVTNTEVQA